MSAILGCGDPARTATGAPWGESPPAVDCTAPLRRVRSGTRALSGCRTPVDRSITTGQQRAWLLHSAVSQRMGPTASTVPVVTRLVPLALSFHRGVWADRRA